MKMPGNTEDQENVEHVWQLEKASLWRSRISEKNGQVGRKSDLAQKMLGLCETENGTQIDGLQQSWSK